MVVTYSKWVFSNQLNTYTGHTKVCKINGLDLYFLKKDLFTFICECLSHVVMWTACVQCPLRPDEDAGSSESIE